MSDEQRGARDEGDAGPPQGLASGTVDTPVVTSVRMIRNTIVNGVATVSGMAITLVLTPVMLNRLGVDSFGIWALALALTVGSGYLALTDLGLQQGATRMLSVARRSNDVDEINAIFSATVLTFLGVSVVVAFVVAACAGLFADLFRVHAALRHAAVVTFALIAFQVVFDLPALAYRSLLESAQRFPTIRVVDLSRSIVFAILVVVVLLLGRGVVAVASMSLTAAAFTLASFIVIVRRSEGAVHLDRKALTRERLRQLLGFSSSLFVLRILSVTYRQMDKVIIGIALAVGAVSSFEIANRLGLALLLALGVMGSTLLPAAALSVGDSRRLREIFLRTTAYSVAVFVPLSVGAIIFAAPLIHAWVGHAVGNDAVSASRLFFAWVGLGAFDVAGTTMLVAAGRLRPIVVLSIVWVAANLALSIAFVHVWGVAGVVAATVISYTPLLIAYTVICLDEFAISARSWARRVIVPIVPGIALQLVVCAALASQIERLGSYGAAVLGIGGTTLLAVAVYAAVGIERNERRLLLGSLRAALRR